MKARKETPTRGAPAVCFHAIDLKVLISENHKAQTLSAEADSYVKNTLFYVTCSYSKPLLKRVIDGRNLFTIMTQSHFTIQKS